MSTPELLTKAFTEIKIPPSPAGDALAVLCKLPEISKRPALIRVQRDKAAADRGCPSHRARAKTRRQKGAEAHGAGLRGRQPPRGLVIPSSFEAPSRRQVFSQTGWETCYRPGAAGSRGLQHPRSPAGREGAARGRGSAALPGANRAATALGTAGGGAGGKPPERGRAADSAGSTTPPAGPADAEDADPSAGRGGRGRGRGRGRAGGPHLYHSSPRS